MSARSHVAEWRSGLAIRILNPVTEHWSVREGYTSIREAGP